MQSGVYTFTAKKCEAVDMIRAGQREEVLPVIDEIEKEYQKVIEQIQKLD